MKKICAIIVFLLSLSLSASHVHLSLTGVTNATKFYYCGTTVDSVIVHKPDSVDISDWFGPGVTYIAADSIVITQSIQGHWYCQYGPNSFIGFYVYFVSIPPTQPWTATDTVKCPESSIILKGQATDQPDFTYVWSTGSIASQIIVDTPGTYMVTITGACGSTITDQINVLNYSKPIPNLGADTEICHGNTVTLNPGTFAGYAWSTGVSTPTIAVTIGGTYRVTVTDDNGCHASDTVTVTFLFPPIPSIKMVSIETDPTSPYYSNNKVMWETNLTNVDSVFIWRETTSTIYEEVGKVPYGTGAFTDTVSSKLRSWAYKIQFQDTCENLSALSDYHKTCKVSVNVSVGGFTANWTDYEIEGGEKALLISKYEIYTGEVLNALSYLTYVPGSQNTYGPFAFTDSLVVVAAVITTTTKTEITALSFPITEYDAVSIGEYQDLLTFDLYPNPSTGDFTVSGEGMLSIYNVIGECIFTETIDGTKTIHLNNSGIYMVKMTNKQNVTFIQKVIIQ